MKYFPIFLAILFMTTLTGCEPTLIKGVTTKVDPNLETVNVTLNFDKSVITDLGGTFLVKEYGSIDVSPSTKTVPFHVGFNLNTSILNDQEYLTFTPTRYLPSGQPIPAYVDRAMAQVELKKEVSTKFDAFAYLDVLGAEWIGVALTLNFLDAKHFPPGLSLAQRFVQSKTGEYRVAAAVFGPRVDNNGSLLVPGGIALFANARGLIRDARASQRGVATDYGMHLLSFDGPLAPRFRKHPTDAIVVTEGFKAALRENITAP